MSQKCPKCPMCPHCLLFTFVLSFVINLITKKTFVNTKTTSKSILRIESVLTPKKSEFSSKNPVLISTSAANFVVKSFS